ncbi:alpha/beta fold hydrolase [Embleya sp. AB8]|uniref:alpha/beta fold hydrolase n=1 Tax=Embleya sp. AB8 TaxID=3156304 RepID=UPI003C73591E
MTSFFATRSRPDRRRRRSAGFAVGLGVAGVLGLTPTAAASTPPADRSAATRRIDWHPCAEDTSADCGTLTLPMDWAHPRGRTFDMAVARRRAGDATARIGSLVTDFGGPGQSGVDAVVGRRTDVFPAEVRARFDLVGFDARGFGRSSPITCDMPALGRQPAGDPGTDRGYAELVDYNRRMAANCRALTGSMYDHVDTRSIVRDVEALRRALGDRRLTYWGASYGTLIGQQYAELFPGRIRAMTLDSNLDHAQDVRGYLDTSAAAVEDSFAGFAAWCGASTRCALHGRDVGTVFDDLYARAEAGTLYDPATPANGVTPDFLVRQAQRAFAFPGWTGFADLLAAMDAAPPHPVSPNSPSLNGRWVGYDQKMFCSDRQLDLGDAGTVAATERRLARSAPHTRRSPVAWGVAMSCQGHPVALTNPPRRGHPARTDTITLVNNLHDPNTPYTWATSLALRLPGAVLVGSEAWGHGAIDKSPCVATVTTRSLVDAHRPAPGTRCPAPAPTAAAH